MAFSVAYSPSLKPRFCWRSGTRFSNESMKNALPQELGFSCNPVSCVCVCTCALFADVLSCVRTRVQSYYCVCECERVSASTHSQVIPCFVSFHTHTHTCVHIHTTEHGQRDIAHTSERGAGNDAYWQPRSGHAKNAGSCPRAPACVQRDRFALCERVRSRTPHPSRPAAAARARSRGRLCHRGERTPKVRAPLRSCRARRCTVAGRGRAPRRRGRVRHCVVALERQQWKGRGLDARWCFVFVREVLFAIPR